MLDRLTHLVSSLPRLFSLSLSLSLSLPIVFRFFPFQTLVEFVKVVLFPGRRCAYECVGVPGTVQETTAWTSLR